MINNSMSLYRLQVTHVMAVSRESTYPLWLFQLTMKRTNTHSFIIPIRHINYSSLRKSVRNDGRHLSVIVDSAFWKSRFPPLTALPVGESVGCKRRST